MRVFVQREKELYTPAGLCVMRVYIYVCVCVYVYCANGIYGHTEVFN